MKRSSLKKLSDKNREAVDEWGPKRKAYCAQFECPLYGSIATEVHEILGGSNRHLTYQEPCAWLALSTQGHRDVQDWPKARQLALKLVVDPDNFDLQRINDLYRVGGRDWPITMRDIAQHLTWL